MTGAGRFACGDFAELAPELALGILPARNRAAVAHVQDCPACREHVRQLVRAADGLLELVPPGEPPVGFETRVLGRLGVPTAEGAGHRSLRRFRRRLALAAAAAAAAVGAGLGGWTIGQSPGEPVPAVTAAGPHPGAWLADSALTLPGPSASPGHNVGKPVGRAFAYGGSPPWVYVSVEADQAAGRIDGTVRCQIERGDGSTATIGSFAISHGYGQWGGAYPAGPSPVTGLRLVAANGTVVAATTFTPGPS